MLQKERIATQRSIEPSDPGTGIGNSSITFGYSDVAVSIPLRYMHTGVSLYHYQMWNQ